MFLNVPAIAPPQNRHAVAIRVTRRVSFLFFISLDSSMRQLMRLRLAGSWFQWGPAGRRCAGQSQRDNSTLSSMPHNKKQGPPDVTVAFRPVQTTTLEDAIQQGMPVLLWHPDNFESWWQDVLKRLI